jgi:hypothetical protein
LLIPNQAVLDGWQPEEGVDAFLITLQCVARWADGCAIWPLGHPGAAGYEGSLPAELPARNALIARAWNETGDWAERQYGPGYRLAAARLWAGDEELLDNHDATWESYSEIRLTPARVQVLRECWTQHGVPVDLYAPGRSIWDRPTAD